MSIKTDHNSVKSFRLVDINDLPKYSHWPARLIGLSEFSPANRTEQLVLEEYGQKWGKLLQDYTTQTFVDLGKAIDYLFRSYFPPFFLFHIGEQIYHSENSPEFWSFIYSEIVARLAPYLTSDDTLVELGCGWGRNLLYSLRHSLCKNALGGEFTEEGVRLGTFIGEQFNLPVEFFHFDWYHPAQEFMHQLKDAVIFTHNSIEQIGTMPEETILRLIESEPKIVIHFEPIYEYRKQETLLHFFWKKYTEINDYNRNLLTVLKMIEQQGRLEILNEEVHALGLNAFNPGSFISWKPLSKRH